MNVTGPTTCLLVCAALIAVAGLPVAGAVLAAFCAIYEFVILLWFAD